jgi:ribosomal protein L20A (L18A)
LTTGITILKLTDDSVRDINVVGDWLYYANGSDMFNIYKIRTDGTERTSLNVGGTYINVAGNWIFYDDGNGNFYKIHSDGTDKQLVK